MMSFFTKVYHRVNVRSLAGWAAPPKINPGIHLRRKVLNATEDLEDLDNEFDDLETDFMDVHKSHKEHVQEYKVHKEKEKFHIVKQKYFKETHFNFLTWHDKEQIRYLHNSDPEEWTVEKLSEGFPALPQDIKKIIKSKWTINPTRMKSHDRSAQRNWESFRKGEIKDLSKDLVDHLNKFTDRAFNFKPFEPPEKIDVAIETKKPASTEFSEIITSYQELKNKNKHNYESKEVSVSINTDSVDNDQNRDDKKRTVKSKPITLLALQNELEDKVNKGSDLSVDEKLLIKGVRQLSQEHNVVEMTQSDVSDIIKNKYDTSTSVELVNKKPYDIAHLIYPQKIMIPKNIRKRGYTYKLNDCYYDDYGRFLYRVPGMD